MAQESAEAKEEELKKSAVLHSAAAKQQEGALENAVGFGEEMPDDLGENCCHGLEARLQGVKE